MITTEEQFNKEEGIEQRFNNILKRESIEVIAEKLNIETVPITCKGTIKELSDFVAKGFDSKWGDFEAEGIVATPTVGLNNRMGHRIITKLKCSDFK